MASREKHKHKQDQARESWESLEEKKIAIIEACTLKVEVK
jgi:hypothetical protein